MCDKVEREIKKLRDEMIRRVVKSDLLDAKVVEISQSLDEKILEKMKERIVN